MENLHYIHYKQKLKKKKIDLQIITPFFFVYSILFHSKASPVVCLARKPLRWTDESDLNTMNIWLLKATIGCGTFAPQ